MFPAPPAREPDFFDDFSGNDLREDLWVAHYLPHWSTRDRSRARFDLLPAGGLRLLIDEDQLDWREEDAPLRVSNLQTGVFSGPLGSGVGTHRHRDGLTVRTNTPERILWGPTAGRVDITVAASRDDGCMLAAWLVGTEVDSPEHSGEICVFEIDASAIGPTSFTARSGVKAHGDPTAETDMSEVAHQFDAGTAHTWSVVWGAEGTAIGCEGRVVKRSTWAPSYPVILMVDLFEIGPRSTIDDAYPKSAVVSAVHGWQF